MIELKTNNGSPALQVDQEITLQRNSPLYFKYEEYSLPFELPKTPNDPMFGYPIRPGAQNKVKSMAATLFANGMRINSGLLELSKGSEKDEKLTANFRSNRNDFMFNYGDTYIRNLNWITRQYVSGVSNPTGQQLIDAMKASADGNMDYYAFPVWCSDYYGNGVGEWINKWDFDNYNFDITHYKRSVFPRMYKVLDELFSLMGYTINSNWFTGTTERRNIVVFNMDNITSGSYTFGQKVPGLKVADFLNALEAFFPIAFFINSHSKQVDIISSSDIINSTPVDLPGELLVGREVTFELNDTGYDIKIPKLDDDTSTEQEYEYVDDLISATSYDTFSALPTATENATAWVKADGMLYEGQKDDLGVVSWQPIGNKCQSVKSLDGGTSEEINLYPVVNKTQTITESVEISVTGTPSQVNVDITRQTPWTAMRWSKWSKYLRLTVFRGWELPDIDESSLPSGFVYSRDKHYPMASFVGWHMDGSRWLSNYIDLAFQGTYSIFDTDKWNLPDNSEKASEEILMTEKNYQEFGTKNLYWLRGQKALVYESSAKVKSEDDKISVQVNFLAW